MADSIEDRIEEITEKFGDLDEGMQDAIVAIAKNNSLSNTQIQLMRKRNKAAIEEEQVRKKLMKQYKLTNKQYEDMVANQEEASDAAVNMVSSLMTMGSTINNHIIKPLAQYTASIQEGTNANQSVTPVIKSFTSSVAEFAGILAPVLAGIGAALMLIPGGQLFGAIGLGASAAAFGLAGLAGALTVAQIAIDIVSKELDKVEKAFSATTGAGMMFTDGMTGMIRAAGQADLTLSQFSNAVSKQAKSLAAAGMGMSGAMNSFANANAAMGKTGITEQMQKLGFSFEEQAELVAETMNNMRSSGLGPLMAPGSQIAIQTQRYAENLKLIASITGEDAKAKMAESRQMATELAFQQKLAGKTATERANIMDAFNAMPKAMQKNFMDLTVFGGVVNKTGAIMTAQSTSQAAVQNKLFADMENGTLTGKSALETIGKHQEGMHKDLMNATGIAMAGLAGVGGPANDAAKAMGEFFQVIKKHTKEATDSAFGSLKGQKNTEDGLTDSALLANRIANQNTKLIEQASEQTGALTLYADGLAAASDVANAGLRALADWAYEISGRKPAGVAKTVEDTSLDEDIFYNMQKMRDSVETSIADTFGYEANTNLGSDLSVDRKDKDGTSMSQQEIDAATLRGMEIAKQIAKENGYANDEGYADGGVASGPKSGYDATLHGTEAVVPLPDGNSIPVKVDMGELTASIEQQSSLLSKISRELEKTNSTLGKININTA